MPALGESVTEGTVTTWLKSVGDAVDADEPLLEVSTDKVDSEVPSPVAGFLAEIRVPEDETVEVGTVVAIISSSAPSAAPVAQAAAPAAPLPRLLPQRLPLLQHRSLRRLPPLRLTRSRTRRRWLRRLLLLRLLRHLPS